MKNIAAFVLPSILGLGIYFAGYMAGSKQGRERVVMEAGRFAADTCLVHTLATIKTATRMIEAKNRQSWRRPL